MKFAVGGTNGKVNIFDIRSREPLVTRDHKNGLPNYVRLKNAPVKKKLAKSFEV